MTPELASYGLAIAGALALVLALVRHVRADRRDASANAQRAALEREQFHSLTALMEEIGAVVNAAAARAEDKLAALERVLKHAEQRSARINTLLDQDKTRRAG